MTVDSCWHNGYGVVLVTEVKSIAVTALFLAHSHSSIPLPNLAHAALFQT